ncbi:MAG: hypothetical protein WKG00_25010 [Polyangiaceae bacterium]
MISARGAVVDIRSDHGTPTRVVRAEVTEVRLYPHQGRDLLVVPDRHLVSGGVDIVSVPEEYELVAEARGWRPVAPFEEPVQLFLRGTSLTVQGSNAVHTVAVGDLDLVKLRQPRDGPNWVVLGAVLGGAVAVGGLLALCAATWCSYGAPR